MEGETPRSVKCCLLLSTMGSLGKEKAEGDL